MYRIVRAPLRHVAADAVAGLGVFSRMTLAAYTVVMRDSFFAARYVVRIVAGGATQLAFAFHKTRGTPQPVRRACDFKFVVVA